MTRLSVNINKIALIRNSRGGNTPDILKIAQDIEAFGGQGITVHPRPDERHIRYSDVPLLKNIVRTELNVEGNPDQRFMDMVLKHRPHQCTLVPDAANALTSDTGWDTIQHFSFLSEITQSLQEKNIRVSIFVNPEERFIEAAKKIGAHRIELYTGNYAALYPLNKDKAIEPFIRSAQFAQKIDIGVNAGHDLNLENLAFFAAKIPNLLEVSIGHALVSDSLYFGLHNTIQQYLHLLENYYN